MSTTNDLQRQAERDRTRIAETVDALRSRMAPGQIVDQAIAYARDHGGAEFVRNLGGQVKANPLPVALIATAIGWLMLGRSPSSRRISSPPIAPDHIDPSSGPDGKSLDERFAGLARDAASQRESSDTPGASEAFRSARDGVPGAAASVRDKVRSTYRSAADALHRTGDVAHDATSATTTAPRETAQDVRDYFTEGDDHAAERANHADWRASHAGARIANGAERAQATIRRVAREQPLVIGAVGLALGAILGTLLPRTRREDAVLGDTSDQFKATTADTFRDSLAEAQDAGGRIIDKVRGEAEAQGFVPGSAEQVAREVGFEIGSVAAATRSSGQDGFKSATAEADQEQDSRTRQSREDDGTAHEPANVQSTGQSVSRFSEADPTAMPKARQPG